MAPGTGIDDGPMAGAIPSDYVLTQNYPNPFNPSTNIRYSCPTAGYVRVEVRNLLGQHIKTLVDSEKSRGYHEVVWHGDNAAGDPVASGVYFYTLITNNSMTSQKMILMR